MDGIVTEKATCNILPYIFIEQATTSGFLVSFIFTEIQITIGDSQRVAVIRGLLWMGNYVIFSMYG